MSGQVDPHTEVYWCLCCGPVLRLVSDNYTQTMHCLTEAQHTYPVALTDEEDHPTQ